MIVGIDARFLTHPQSGGFKTYTHSLVWSLAVADGNNRYIVYTDRRAAELGLPRNFSVRPVSGGNAVIREQLVLPLVMKHDQVQVAHFPCNTAPVLFGPRTVVTMHDAMPVRRTGNVCSNRELRQRMLRSYWRAVMPRAARQAEIVVTVSQHSMADLRVNLNVASSRLRVVLQAIDPLFLDGSLGTRPTEMNADSPFILAFASPDGRKNHSAAIDAYRGVKKSRPGLRLALVCSRADLRSSQDCRDEGVVPLGPVSVEELMWLYRNALLLVFPSLDEGFGLPPLEAMACGTPVVASSAGSLQETLGCCAVYANPHDVGSISQGIQRILGDPALSARLSEEGREHAASFTRQRMGEGLAAVYREAASTRP